MTIRKTIYQCDVCLEDCNPVTSLPWAYNFERESGERVHGVLGVKIKVGGNGGHTCKACADRLVLEYAASDQITKEGDV
jgi:hypothetical protein